MKYILLMPLLIFLLSSCSKELHTTKRALKHRDQIVALSEKLIRQFNRETFITPVTLDSQGLSRADLRLVRHKLKCPFIHIIYNGRYARFFEGDSVVIFTRPGFPVFGNEYNIILDMKRPLRDSIPVPRHYSKYYKLTKGMYYIEEPMPVF